MKTFGRYALIPLIFVFLAVLLRYSIAPLLERLPANYSNRVALSEEAQFRDSPSAEWQASTLDTVRVDQTITNTSRISIIEGALHVYFTSGAVNFEVTNLYGVDRNTRQNVSGYGDVSRTGQYLFSPHVQKGAYPVWDPFFVGLRMATFDHVEKINGLQVYVFKFAGIGMDETAGYDYLSGVPEKYFVHTDGEGTIWVEPLSGAIVDYQDSGVSYFVDPASGKRVADFNKWTEKFTPDTLTAQIARAHSSRTSILVLEDYLPAGLILVGLLVQVVILLKMRNLRKKNSKDEANPA
ncbi:MAG: porin PorA family protein [Anaerolineaceae bacterium]